MRFHIDEVIRLTDARLLRWNGPDHVRPILDVSIAQPGDVLFAMRPSLITPESLASLSAAGSSGVAIYSGQVPPGPEFENLGVLSLASPALAFFKLATTARERSGALVIGITGTSGKSATKEYVARTLEGQYTTVKTLDSLNRISDNAAALLALDQGANQAAILEMGFGQVGDVNRMAAMATPDFGIITNVTMAHLDGAGGSWETVVTEKGRMANHLRPTGALILNSDDTGCQLVSQHYRDARIFSYGSGPTAMVRVHDVKVSEQGTEMRIRAFGQQLHCKIRAVGNVQALNATAAILGAHLSGVAMAEAIDLIAAVPSLSRRFEVYRFERSLTLIDDTFSASPDAMMKGLSCAGTLAKDRRKLAVLSDIALLGEHSSKKHQAIGRAAATSGFDELVLYGDEGTADIRQGAIEAGIPPESISVISRRDDLLPTMSKSILSESMIYCKARQGLWIGPVIDQLRMEIEAKGFSPMAGDPQ